MMPLWAAGPILNWLVPLFVTVLCVSVPVFAYVGVTIYRERRRRPEARRSKPALATGSSSSLPHHKNVAAAGAGPSLDGLSLLTVSANSSSTSRKTPDGAVDGSGTGGDDSLPTTPSAIVYDTEEDLDALFQTGLSLEEEGEVTLALRIYLSCLTLKSTKPFSHITSCLRRTADLMFRMGRFVEASKLLAAEKVIYEKALLKERTPKNSVQAMKELSRIFAKEGLIELAASYSRRAETLRREARDPLQHLGSLQRFGDDVNGDGVSRLAERGRGLYSAAVETD